MKVGEEEGLRDGNVRALGHLWCFSCDDVPFGYQDMLMIHHVIVM